MFKLMHKKLNKKGFTLAELLVVVAIIAILVAIAIPIFTDNLEKAQIATNKANIRATKAAAASMILEDWDKYSDDTDYEHYKTNGWWASGYIDASGELLEIQIFDREALDTTSDPYGYVKKGVTEPLTAKPSAVRDVVEVAKSGNTQPPYATLVWVDHTAIKGAD